MPSAASGSFLSSVASADSLKSAAGDARLRPISAATKSDFLHAALAAYVAAWDAYLNGVVLEFRDKINDPLNVEYSGLHTRYSDFVSRSLERFNTPNSNNSRVLLVQCTGYDPIGDWVWTRAGMNGLQARTFLDEILKVRHSFAHGFSIPSYTWTVTPTGRRQLSGGSVEKARRFLRHIVLVTDAGLWAHGRSQYPTKHHW